MDQQQKVLVLQMVVIQEGQVSVYTQGKRIDNTAYAVIIDSIDKIYYETHD